MNAIAGPVMQIGCVAFGVDLMLGTINGVAFPLTNMVIKTATEAFSAVIYTGTFIVISVAGPVYGSLILVGAGLFATEYFGITNFKQDLNECYSSFFNIAKLEDAENLTGVTENLSYDI